jgi:putative protease
MSLNFAHQQPGHADMLYDSSRLEQDYEPVAVVRDTGRLGPEVELRNVCHRGEVIEYMGPGIEVDRFRIEEMQDVEGRHVERANPGGRLVWVLSGEGRQFSVNSIFRRKKSKSGSG